MQKSAIEQLNEQEYIDRELPDGRHLTVQVLFGGMAQLGISGNPPFIRIFEDSWDFLNRSTALAAFSLWDEQTTEPQGWHRHSRTGRYRIDGDPALEYVKYPGSAKSIEEEIKYAVQITQGKDRVITEVIVHPVQINGWQSFIVVSESNECTHTPPCIWYDRAFRWLDRTVVLAQRDFFTTSVANVKRRLTGENSR